MDPPVTKTVHEVAAVGFELQTKNYAETRPSYPNEAIDHLKALFPPPCEVLDLAAGTGIMTKLLVNVGYSVKAVEPANRMRDQFREILPNVEILDGNSYQIPVPSESLDLVIVAQAFHWFDDITSLREIHRVLKSTGNAVLIWNMESPRENWVAQLRSVYEEFDKDAPQYRKGRWREVFQTEEAKTLFDLPFKQEMFSNDFYVKKSDIWRRVLSKSYISRLAPEEQERVRERVEEIIATTLGHTDDQDPVLYPHDTEMVWFSKKDKK